MKAVDMARNSATTLAVIAILCLGSLFMLANHLRLGSYSYGSPHPTRGAVTHIVLFQFKETAAAIDIAETNRQMLVLKDDCLHPVTRIPYIKSLAGGKDNSIEGLQNGVTHAFVVEFESAEDRDYYVKADPTHKAFIQSAASVLEKAIVVDFSDRVF